MQVVVCWKWVAIDDDPRWAGVSPADRAALEVALRMASASDGRVTVVSVGPVGAETGLREALAAGADRVVRVDAPADLRSDVVATTIARLAGGADWIVCGDYSLDRGSGSVPALLAAELDAAQALGLVHVEHVGAVVRGVRRLDGGRREDLELEAPAVLSVEGSVAQLRRATLRAELAAREAVIEVSHGPDGPCDAPAEVRPFRPRPRQLPAPEGTSALDRVRALTDTGESGHGETVVLDPPAAAARILDALAAWGYLDRS